MMDETITISKKEYFELRMDQIRLDMLDAGGVDNWDWYGESLNPAEGRSYDDQEEELKKEILGG